MNLNIMLKSNIKLNIVLIVLITFDLTTTSFSQSGWIKQTYETNKYVCVDFINDSVGYSVSRERKIYKTIDAGISWLITNITINSNATVADAMFLDENVFALYSGLLRFTTNGGANWNEYVISPIGIGSISIKRIFLINHSTAFVCGNDFGTLNSQSYVDGIIYKTTNSGLSWFESYRGGVDFYDIKFNGDLKGYCAWSAVMKTTNGGINWDYFGDAIAVTFSISKNFNDTLYMSSDSGKIYRSINGGANWTKFYTPASDTLKELYFINSKTGYAVGDGGTIIYTTNAGMNWVLQSSNTLANLNGVCFTNKDSGYVVGDSGIILRSYTGGLTSVPNTNFKYPGDYTLYQNYPNPFNPSTTIRYEIPQTSNVKLIIYNTVGKEITTLVNEKQSAGSYEVEFNGNNLPNGVYFYRIESGEFSYVKRMVMIK